MEIDPKGLEDALNSAKNESTPVETSKSQMSEEEERGFHKGSLNTLSSERNELLKMVGNVEAIMQAHISRLKELGVKINDGK
jgi:hypothetical protein